MRTETPLWAYLLLAICVILLAVGVYLIFNPQTSNIMIKPYPTNISELLSPNLSINNTTGVVKLGS